MPAEDTLVVLKLRVNVLIQLVGNYQQTVKMQGVLQREDWLAVLAHVDSLLLTVKKEKFKESMIKAHD